MSARVNDGSRGSQASGKCGCKKSGNCGCHGRTSTPSSSGLRGSSQVVRTQGGPIIRPGLLVPSNTGLVLGRSSLSHGSALHDKRIKGGHQRRWCGTCRMNDAIKRGLLTEADSRNVLQGWAGRGKRRPTGRKGVEYSWAIDTNGYDGCSDANVDQIEDAISYIISNLNPGVTTSCTRNDGTGNCSATNTRTCFGGHGYGGLTNPRTLVRKTLLEDNINFVINCNSNSSCREDGVTAYTNCGQYNDAQQDIHICNDYLSGEPPTSQLACVIVHEILHVWGADENAVEAMEPNGWDCITP